MMSSPTLHFSSRIESNRCHGNNFGDNIRQSQQKSNKQFNKIRQFIASKSQTSEICTEKMGTRTIDQHKINETSPVFHNSIHNDSFNNQERAEYDKLIAELQATLVKERMEHNIFLKEMAELLAETKCDSEYEDQLEISANVNKQNYVTHNFVINYFLFAAF